MSFKNKFIFNQIKNLNTKHFYQTFHNSSIKNQRIKIKLICDFDMDLERLIQMVKNILLALRNLYLYLNQDFIDLEILNKQASDLLTLRQNITSLYLKLFNINSDNKNLHKCTEIFLKFFSQQKTHINNLIKQSTNVFMKDWKKGDEFLNLFHPNSCSFFVSLLNPPGIIT